MKQRAEAPDPGRDDDEGEEVLEQQNLRIPLETKSHLARLAAARRMTLPRFLVDVVLAEYVDASRKELQAMYLKEAARAQATAEKLAPPDRPRVGGRKQ